MFKVFLVFIFAFQVIAQDYSDLGFASQDETAEIKEGAQAKNTTESAISRPAPKECSSSDQISLPLRDLKALMIFKGSDLSVKTQGSGDYLSVSLDSPIMGNCNSMLEPKLRWSTKYGKYLYEVKIRKPCDDNICEYEVSHMSAGEKIVQAKKYESNLKGFYECMKENVGINEVDGKKSWDKSKIVRKDLETVSINSPITSDLLFVSKGPLAMQKSKEKNLISNSDCDFYENIGLGYKHYSRSDLEYKNLEEQAQALCKSSKYSDVESSLSSFEGHGGLYDQLIKVRDQLLLKEIIKERARLQDLIADKNLSEIDVANYNKLISDYYDLIIDKNMSTKNHTEQDKNNDELLVNMKFEYDQAIAAGNYELAEIYKKKIQNKTDELAKFLKPPYFSVEDYRAMVDISNKPQLNSQNWKSASTKLHMSLMSLKLLCEAYGISDTCTAEKPTNKNFKEKKSGIVDLNAVIKRAKEWNDKVVDDYDEKLSLITTPNGYKSLKYQKLIDECKGHELVAKQYASGLQIESQKIAQACQTQSGGNQNVYQQCIESYKNQILGDAKSLGLKSENCQTMMTHYKEQKAKWEKLEEDRDIYLDLSDEQKKSKKEKVAKVMEKDKYKYDFSYKGTNSSNVNHLPFQGSWDSFSSSSQPSKTMNPFLMYGNTNSGLQSNNGLFQGPQYYNQSNFSNYMQPSNNQYNAGFNWGMNLGSGQSYNPNQYQFGQSNLYNGAAASYMYSGSSLYQTPTSQPGGFQFNFNN